MLKIPQLESGAQNGLQGQTMVIRYPPMPVLRVSVLPLYLCFAIVALPAAPVEKKAKITKQVKTGGRDYSTFLFSPESDDPGWVFGAGMRMTIIPKRVAESATRFFPILEAYLNKDFLRYFQWRSALGALYVQNYISTGVYAVVHRRFLSVYVGNSVSLWGGVFTSSGFDAVSATVITNPSVSVGKNLSHYYYWLPDSFSITYKLNILHNRYVRLGNSVFQEKSFSFEGYSILFMAEYYAGKGGMYFGLQINRARPGYEFWLAFSDYDQFFNYTTLFAGYRF